MSDFRTTMILRAATHDNKDSDGTGSSLFYQCPNCGNVARRWMSYCDSQRCAVKCNQCAPTEPTDER